MVVFIFFIQILIEHFIRNHRDPDQRPRSVASDLGLQCLFFSMSLNKNSRLNRERSGSVVECLTRDRGAAGSSLAGVAALWSLSKTHSS